jgi:hypothetical protein
MKNSHRHFTCLLAEPMLPIAAFAKLPQASHMKRFTIALLLIAASRCAAAEQPQAAFQEEIQDYDDKSGIGCNSRPPVTKNAQFHFVCRSRRSGESAWNAALYRGKLACHGANFDVLSNVPPSLPDEGEIYVAQVELKCKGA